MSYKCRVNLSDEGVGNSIINASGDLVLRSSTIFHNREIVIGIIDKQELIEIAKLSGIKPEDLDE